MKALSPRLFYQANVRTVVLPKALEQIGDKAFYNCKHLRNVVFRDGSQLKSVGKWCFAGTELEELELPATLKKIGEGALRHCSHLRVVWTERNQVN